MLPEGTSLDTTVSAICWHCRYRVVEVTTMPDYCASEQMPLLQSAAMFDGCKHESTQTLESPASLFFEVRQLTDTAAALDKATSVHVQHGVADASSKRATVQ
jgi:hypothetical protein